MNKKIMYAVGLSALMAACSSEDVLTEVQGSQESDLFAGIEKVDAQFNMGAESRLATKWDIEIGDRVGFAWLTDLDEKLELTGDAYQNHPLNAVSETVLRPATSIYEGEYYVYAPYDYSVKSIDKVNFSIPETQDLLSEWNGLAKDAIFISPKWTTVSNSVYDEGEPGINKNYTIYPAKFSNGVGLDFSYKNNEVNLKDETDNNKEIQSDPEIFEVKVGYLTAVDGENVTVNKFKYAPTAETNEDNWEKRIIGVTSDATATTSVRSVVLQAANGVEVLEGTGYYSLKPVAGVTYTASREKEKGQFVYNALPAQTEVGDDTHVQFVITTTYGVITYTLPVNEVAKTAYANQAGGTYYLDYFDGITKDETGANLADNVCTDYTESFVQVLGKNGKFVAEVDFTDAVMNGMHVRDDAHLLQLLRFYRDYKLGTEYAESDVILYLDAENGKFEISKAAIALVQGLNGNPNTNIKLEVCTEHGNPQIVVFNNGEDKEVPSFSYVFNSQVEVFLKNQEWTWNGNSKKETGNVTKIRNLGSLKINAASVAAGNSYYTNLFTGLVNEAAASIEVKSVANVKIDLTNYGKIDVNAGAELLAYGADIVNDATSLTAQGIINNSGVLAIVEKTDGTISNYGTINNKVGGANNRTYISTNQTENANFANEWSSTNKFGTIILKDKFDKVSVNNDEDKDKKQGFIKYTWTGEGVYTTPTPEENVKYNYLIVSKDIQFVEEEQELKYLEIAGTVTLTAKEYEFTSETNALNGIIVNENASLDINKTNYLKAGAAFVKGSVYVGGKFLYNEDLVTYLGGATTDKDNIRIQ